MGHYNSGCGGLQYHSDTSNTRTSPGTCLQCPTGFYKDFVGVGMCTACGTCGPGQRRTSCGSLNGDNSNPAMACANAI